MQWSILKCNLASNLNVIYIEIGKQHGCYSSFRHQVSDVKSSANHRACTLCVYFRESARRKGDDRKSRRRNCFLSGRLRRKFCRSSCHALAPISRACAYSFLSRVEQFVAPGVQKTRRGGDKRATATTMQPSEIAWNLEYQRGAKLTSKSFWVTCLRFNH